MGNRCARFFDDEQGSAGKKCRGIIALHVSHPSFGIYNWPFHKIALGSPHEIAPQRSGSQPIRFDSSAIWCDIRKPALAMAQHSASDDATVKDTCYAMIQLEDPDCAIDGSVVKRLPGDSVFFCVYNRIQRTAGTYVSREDPRFKLVFLEHSLMWGAPHAVHGGIWELRREQGGGETMF